MTEITALLATVSDKDYNYWINVSDYLLRDKANNLITGNYKVTIVHSVGGSSNDGPWISDDYYHVNNGSIVVGGSGGPLTGVYYNLDEQNILERCAF